MLVVKDDRVINLNNVSDLDISEGFSDGYFIEFGMNFSPPTYEGNPGIQECNIFKWKHKEDRDEAFETILVDYANGKKVCRLD